MNIAPLNVFGRLSIAALFVCSTTHAAPGGGKRYYIDLAGVTTGEQVKPEIAKVAVPRVEAEVKKELAEHPELVEKLEGAPDPKDEEAYRTFLAKQKIAGAYKVKVEIKEATEERTEGPPMLSVHLALRILGEKIPDATLGMSGEAKAGIKQELGAKLRESDRIGAWDSVAEVVVKQALTTALEQLEKPKGKGGKKH
jgi:hypothetical protein